MKFSEKKMLVLQTLYENRFDGKSHKISDLLSNHGVEVAYHEAVQIVQVLQNDGMVVQAISNQNVSARITGEGVEFVEGYDVLNDDGNPSSDFSQEDILLINIKLDELLARIAKMELGQQITYDDISKEIEDLKMLTRKLNKKNWFEVLQGKLIAIGLGKLTDKAIELISSTFGAQNLTNLNP